MNSKYLAEKFKKNQTKPGGDIIIMQTVTADGHKSWLDQDKWKF